VQPTGHALQLVTATKVPLGHVGTQLPLETSRGEVQAVHETTSGAVALAR